MSPPYVLCHQAFQVPDESIELCIPVSALSSTSLSSSSISSFTPPDSSVSFYTDSKLVPWKITLKHCPVLYHPSHYTTTSVDGANSDTNITAPPLLLRLDPGVPVIDSALQTLVRSYRTLHIFSPKLGRDILSQPLVSPCECPVQIILEGLDILEDDFYHFQIWLTGSSRRKSSSLAAATASSSSPMGCPRQQQYPYQQQPAITSASSASAPSAPSAASTCAHLDRLRHCERMLMALRQDSNSPNVIIRLREEQQQQQKHGHVEDNTDSNSDGNGDTCPDRTKNNNEPSSPRNTVTAASTSAAEKHTGSVLQSSPPSSASTTPPHRCGVSQAGSPPPAPLPPLHDRRRALQQSHKSTPEALGHAFGSNNGGSGGVAEKEKIWKAHKVVLETIPYFDRMLNAGFLESQPIFQQQQQQQRYQDASPWLPSSTPATTSSSSSTATSCRPIFEVFLSSKVFPNKNMKYLLDYIYCRDPFPEVAEEENGTQSNQNHNQDRQYHRHHYHDHHGGMNEVVDRVTLQEFLSQSQLNEATTSISTATPPPPSTTALIQSSTSSSSYSSQTSVSSSLPSSSLLVVAGAGAGAAESAPSWVSFGLNDWGALYQLGQMLEMPDLAQTSLDQIRRFLNTGEEEEEDNNITVMDEFMEWGYRHETIKALMMDFLIRQRHRVFGIEEENQLRPYLCADHEEQLETLVQLTSRISKS